MLGTQRRDSELATAAFELVTKTTNGDDFVGVRGV
jgi:hypothetical protein